MRSLCQMDLLRDFQDKDHCGRAGTPSDGGRAETGCSNGELWVFTEECNLRHPLFEVQQLQQWTKDLPHGASIPVEGTEMTTTNKQAQRHGGEHAGWAGQGMPLQEQVDIQAWSIAARPELRSLGFQPLDMFKITDWLRSLRTGLLMERRGGPVPVLWQEEVQKSW